MTKTNLLVGAALLLAAAANCAELRVGIIGTDTSHCLAFTRLLNDPKTKGHVSGAKVVAAYKGGSADVEASRSRVDKIAAELEAKFGVKLYGTIEELCQNVDAVLLESVDGRPHLAQARPVIKAGKPLFVDKPMAASLKDALEIFRLAREAKVPLFSASSLRFGKATQAVRNGSIGKVLHAVTYSPVNIEPHHPELFWYGIHGVESLFTVMGAGCETVKRGTTPDGKIEVTGTWCGDRVGIFREGKYGGTAKGEKGEAPIGTSDGYAPLVAEIVKFFQTGVSPVPERETIEILAFMEASDQSKRLNGQTVKLADILRKHGVK